MSSDAELVAFYGAFNARDLEALRAAMAPDVDWANGMTGGRVHGWAAVRAYWTNQWETLDPHVEPVRVTTDAAGRVVVDVHQVVRDRAGAVLVDQMVRHVYRMRGDLVERMDIQMHEGTMQLYTQLNFGGNCEEAFRFYASQLGGEITMMMTQRQAPGAPDGAGNAIIHARMRIGDTVLIGNDVPPNVFERMRSVYLYLSVDSAAEAERVHAILAEDGTVYMPMVETFYATRFSMLRDRFGVSWSIIHDRPRP